LSKAVIIFLRPITCPVTLARMYLIVRKMKNPDAIAPAMGNPTSPTNPKKSIMHILIAYN
jgi:hypothetical protein